MVYKCESSNTLFISDSIKKQTYQEENDKDRGKKGRYLPGSGSGVPRIHARMTATTESV